MGMIAEGSEPVRRRKLVDQESLPHLPNDVLRSRSNEVNQWVKTARVQLTVTLAGIAHEANRPLFVLAGELNLTEQELGHLISVKDADDPRLLDFLAVCGAPDHTVDAALTQLSSLRDGEWTQKIYAQERARRDRREREAQLAIRERREREAQLAARERETQLVLREREVARAAAEVQSLWSVPTIPIIAVEDAPGHNSKPDPLKAKTEEEFVDAMRRYRVWAHNPSLRKMAQACGQRVSHATFRNMLRASTVPKRFDMVEAFVMALNGTEADMKVWASAWRHFTVPAPQTTSAQNSPDASVHHLTTHRKSSVPEPDQGYTSSVVVRDAGRG